jgi:hypothetical protein
MEFKRKRLRGQNKMLRRTWLSPDGYRIVWRKDVYGVRVPARLQATVRVLIPYSDGQLRQMWDFVSHRRRLIKTLKAAIEECERHYRLWTDVTEVAGVRALKELFGGKLPLGLPLWARKKMDRRLYAILTDNRPGKYYIDDEEDESRTESLSPSSNAPDPGGPFSCLPTEATTDGPAPASPAEGKDESTIWQTRRARSRATGTSDARAAPRAKEAGRAPEKPAAGRTKRVAKRAAKRKLNTTGSSASAKPRPRGSKKAKPLPSVS